MQKSINWGICIKKVHKKKSLFTLYNGVLFLLGFLWLCVTILIAVLIISSQNHISLLNRDTNVTLSLKFTIILAFFSSDPKYQEEKDWNFAVFDDHWLKMGCGGRVCIICTCLILVVIVIVIGFLSWFVLFEDPTTRMKNTPPTQKEVDSLSLDMNK